MIAAHLLQAPVVEGISLSPDGKTLAFDSNLHYTTNSFMTLHQDVLGVRI